MRNNLLLAFYGDDYTGSTDALESLSSAGIRTALFLEPLDREDLAGRFADLQAVGIAGQSRSMTVDEMETALRPAFNSLANLNPAVFQYKVCSTFDSAPSKGSIGRAIDIGRDIFDCSFVPIVVGVPPMEPKGRYVVFGNLFATSDGTTYRIDRHPTMKNHPSTPMTESRLGRHLAEQTDIPTETIDILTLNSGVEGTRIAVERARETADIIIFDTITEENLTILGRIIWENAANNGGMTFGVGSSGFDYALARYLNKAGLVSNHPEPGSVPTVDSIVVLSGSASPTTAKQIKWALNNGYKGIRIDTEALVDPDNATDARKSATETAVNSLSETRGVILYSALGPDDPSIEATRQKAKLHEIESKEIARILGEHQGQILRDVLTQTNVNRVCIAGGDTSSYATPALDVYALEMLAPLEKGAPLCRVSARVDNFDGLEMALKGGQIGGKRYFELTRRGGA